MHIEDFEGEINEENQTLLEHSVDASAFQVMPAAVLYPKSISDIQSAIKYVEKIKKEDQESNISISVRAGGTCMSGGSLNTGLILNLTKYLNKISVDPLEYTALVEMGAMFRDIEREATNLHLMFPPYTSSKDICGIGGMIGNNASGEKSIRLGATIDNVESLEVILHDGTHIKTGPQKISDIERGGVNLSKIENEIYKKLIDLYKSHGENLKSIVKTVPKVSSGYRLERVVKGEMVDLTPIFIGAQGTLGIVTKAILHLAPLPVYTRLVLISIDSLHELPFILHTVMNHNPEGVETYDINTFSRARKTLSSESVLVEPYFSGSATLIVLAQFSESTAEETDERAKDCINALHTHNIRAVFVDDPVLQASVWKIRRSSYSLMRDYNEGSFHAVPCIEDIIVPIDQFPEFIPRLIAILDKYRLFYGFHGHIGEGAFRVIPIFDLGNPKVTDSIISLSREVFLLVKELKGNMTADHGDGIVRSPFLREFYGEELYQAFKEIKEVFDPYGIFNPCKKIGATDELIKKWIKKF